MIDMTPAARQQLDDYLQRIRAELRGARAEVAEELEQNVREHVEIALEQVPAPVSGTDMIAVLDRLGPPEQWLDEEERPVWRRAPGVVDSTRDDSRLPYLSFGLVVASIVLFMMFGFFLLIPAVFVSRAWIDQKLERGEPLGSRRWLVYPAIVLVLAFVTVLVLLLPPLGAMAFVRGDGGAGMFDGASAGERLTPGLRLVLLGGWWIIAGPLCAAALRPIQFVFAPLLERVRRKHFGALAAIGAAVAAAGAALLYYRH
ncbi:MAG TPA: hypothetical protein VF824_21050 [Thermoanaerobaculia bacterium]|jgi:hypothetical protein